MLTLLKHELKSGWKAFAIWVLSVAGMGFLCILLFTSMEESIQDVASSFADMGAFSAMFGLSELSMATLSGFFATEIGVIHALGSAMFAASIATVILSKEEANHYGEFTFSLPVAKSKIVIGKYLSLLIRAVMFSLICAFVYFLGAACISGDLDVKKTIVFMCMQCVMNIEIMSVCFLISAFSKTNKLGIGIGVAMLLYMLDLLSRAIPKLSDVKLLTPFSYSNSTDIFLGREFNALAIGFGIAVIVIASVAGIAVYTKRDLAS